MTNTAAPTRQTAPLALARLSRAHGAPVSVARARRLLAAAPQPDSLAAAHEALARLGLEATPIQASPEQLAAVADQLRFPLLAQVGAGVALVAEPCPPAGASGYYLVITGGAPPVRRLRARLLLERLLPPLAGLALLCLPLASLAGTPGFPALFALLLAQTLGALASGQLLAAAFGRAGALYERVCRMGSGCDGADHRPLALLGLSAHAGLLALWTTAALLPAARDAACLLLALACPVALPLSVGLVARMARSGRWCPWCLGVHAGVTVGAAAGVAVLLLRGLPGGPVVVWVAALAPALLAAGATALTLLSIGDRDRERATARQLHALRAAPGVLEAVHGAGPALEGLPGADPGLLLVSHPLCPYCPAAHDLASKALAGTDRPLRLLMPVLLESADCPLDLAARQPLDGNQLVVLLRAIEAAFGPDELHQALAAVHQRQAAFTRLTPREALAALGLREAPVAAALEAGWQRARRDAVMLQRAGLVESPVLIWRGRRVPDWADAQGLRRLVAARPPARL